MMLICHYYYVIYIIPSSVLLYFPAALILRDFINRLYDLLKCAPQEAADISTTNAAPRR